MMADPEHIAISKSKGIKIDWRDGHRSEYSAPYQRDECPCASCNGAHGSQPQKSNYSGESSGPFPIYRPVLKMDHVEEVGSYAVRIYWSDGHSTGIYSYSHLRQICPCSECQARRSSAAQAVG